MEELGGSLTRKRRIRIFYLALTSNLATSFPHHLESCRSERTVRYDSVLSGCVSFHLSVMTPLRSLLFIILKQILFKLSFSLV